MANKGFNTLVEEMKEKQLSLVNQALQQGIPLSVIMLSLECLHTQLKIESIKILDNENKNYLNELSKEISNEEEV